MPGRIARVTRISAEQVRLERALPVVGAAEIEARGAARIVARAVDQCRDGPKRGWDRFGQRVDGRVVGNVEHDRSGRVAELRAQLFEPLGIAIDEHGAASHGHESPRRRGADSAGRAGQECRAGLCAHARGSRSTRATQRSVCFDAAG